MLAKNINRSLGVALFCTGIASATPSSGCGAQGLQSGVHTVNINGVNRQFTLTLPQNYDVNQAHRLILGIHWWGGTMENVATGNTVETGVFNYYGLERLSEGSAIFVAPQGLNSNWYNEGGSDFAFIDEVIASVEENLCVETEKRFAIGFSWGGAMSYGLACRDTEYPLRAITAIGAAGPIECAPGTSPIGYLGIHGISDNPDNGRSMRNRFIANNGCTGEEKPAPSQGSLTHVRSDYICSGPPVSWVTFDGGHITAPHDGGSGDSGSTFVSPYAWDFFSQF